MCHVIDTLLLGTGSGKKKDKRQGLREKGLVLQSPKCGHFDREARAVDILGRTLSNPSFSFPRVRFLTAKLYIFLKKFLYESYLKKSY
jgi:hypothetical protein